MILSTTSLVSISNRNCKYFLNSGYDFEIGDIIPVNIHHLKPHSRSKVDVQCDKCLSIKCVSYNVYLKNINNGGYYSCSRKCSDDKYKKTCLSIFGTEYPSQNIVIKNKVLNGFLQKYNTTHPSKLDIFEQKKQETNLDRYGVRHQMHLYENQLKIRKTKLIKYGDETFNNVEKSKETKLIKYGDETFNNVEKSKRTMMCRYGVTNNMKDPVMFRENQSSRFRIDVTVDGLYYQSSYELDFIKFCKNNDIYLENGPVIEYHTGDNPRTYHSDFYIPHLNLICEIKSTYIYNLEEEVNLYKEAFSKIGGYNFIFIIDKDYNDLEKIIKKDVKYTTI